MRRDGYNADRSRSLNTVDELRWFVFDIHMQREGKLNWLSSLAIQEERMSGVFKIHINS